MTGLQDIQFGTPSFLQLVDMSETLAPALAIQLGVCALLLALLSLTVWFAASRMKRKFGRIGAIHREQSGAIISADLVLVAVPVLVFVTLLLQMTWFMRETIVVHYAAYQAARSAKVHECPIVPAGVNAGILASRDILCTDKDDVPLEAARFALIPASPAWNIPCLGNCRVPEQVITAIARHSDLSERRNALIKQARYAYDPQNVTVEITRDEPVNILAASLSISPGHRSAVQAELRYRHYVLKWVGKLLGTRRSDGLYYRETRAVVRLT